MLTLNHVAFAGMLLAGRVAILWSYMALSRSSLAEKTRVVRRVVPEEQRDRESHWPLYHFVVFFEVLLICSLGLMDDIPLFNLTGMLLLLFSRIRLNFVEENVFGSKRRSAGSE